LHLFALLILLPAFLPLPLLITLARWTSPRRERRRCGAIRRMSDDDPLTATYRKLIETRSAWMPTWRTNQA